MNAEYEHTHEIGLQTLEKLSTADTFNRWMFDALEPHCAGAILEIGCGLGNLSKYFIEAGSNITLSDVDAEYRNAVSKRFNSEKAKSLVSVIEIDLNDETFHSTYVDHIGKYDTVLAINVLEHIENDQLALQNARLLLRAEGSLVVLTPNVPRLYNRLDRELGHHRRYTMKSLANLYNKAGFTVEQSHLFNALGLLGWFAVGNILARPAMSSAHVYIYNKLVWLAKAVDVVCMKRVGLSILMVGSLDSRSRTTSTAS